ncbi:MAG: response regulator [Bacteroidota bacterium]|nr:response regulator [Bacteroidota bacterium]
MFGSKPQVNTKAQEQKEKISKHLRAADEFFRYNRFEEALTQIDFVFLIDPKNALARSFKERIIMMQKRAQGASAKENPVAMSEEQKQSAVAQLLASADEMIRNKDYKRALNYVADVYKIEPQNYFAKSYSDRIDMLMQQHQQEAAKILSSTTSPSHTDQTGQQSVHGAFFMYRELMKEVWFDGKVTPEEEQELKRVRDIFNITNKEHFEIEREVKTEAYIEALHLAWKDGVLTQNERQVLELMRQKYGISSDEHQLAESKVQEAKKGTPTKATILIVDEDKDHRTGLTTYFTERNYQIFAAANVEEAFRYMVKQFPNIVLTDIIFFSSKLDGFSLFEKTKELSTMQHIPFFFMSKKRDEKIIRAAMRMGLDLYFSKPVDQELLLAAIEGKLRVK